MLSLFLIFVMFNSSTMKNKMAVFFLLFVVSTKTIFSKMMILNFFSQDTLSFLMCFLSVLVSFFCFMISNNLMLKKLVFILLFLVWGFFTSSNFLFLFITFELSILPIFIIINGWGYQIERINSSYYLLLYTLFFSFPFLMCVVFLSNTFFSVSFSVLWLMMKNKQISLVFFLLLVSAFLVKCPVYFLHMWLPKAHVEAPITGSIFLAAILLKLGGVGFSRVFFCFETFFMLKFMFFIMIMGSVMSTILCLIQIDQKCMIAFSSISHMTMVISSFVSSTFSFLSVSMSLFFFHGLISSNLFFMSYMMYMMSTNRLLVLNQGFKTKMIFFYFCLVASLLLNMSVPPFLSFLSEWMIFQNMWLVSFVSMFCIFFLMFFSFLYNIFMMVNSFHGKSIVSLVSPMKVKYSMISSWVVMLMSGLSLHASLYFV